MDNDWAVEIEELVKTFGSFTAVDRISLKVNRGEIFGSSGQTALENPRPSVCSEVS